MPKGTYLTKSGTAVHVTPLGNGRYRLTYPNGQVTFI